MSDFGISLIRTYIPKLVAAIIAGFGAIGIFDIDEPALVLVIVAIAEGLYYALFRWLEHRYPWAGKFLGHSSKPTY